MTPEPSKPRWLRRVAGYHRAPSGLEWTLWKRLPAIALWGTLLLLAIGAWFWWMAPDDPTPQQARELQLVAYRVIGALILHATLVFTVAIGCVVVMIMKGPAYEADPYPPQGRDDARP